MSASDAKAATVCVPILHMHTPSASWCSPEAFRAKFSGDTQGHRAAFALQVHPHGKAGAVVGRGRFLHLDEEASFKCPSSRILKPNQPAKTSCFSRAT